LKHRKLCGIMHLLYYASYDEEGSLCFVNRKGATSAWGIPPFQHIRQPAFASLPFSAYKKGPLMLFASSVHVSYDSSHLQIPRGVRDGLDDQLLLQSFGRP
jgi:hypothetical protein